MSLTDDGGVFWSVEGADDDKAEAFVVLTVDDHVTGLQAATLQGRGYTGCGAGHGGVEARVGVTLRRAVLGRHGAWTAPVHGTQLT